MAQETTTAAELAAVQARLDDAHNAAPVSNLKLEQPTPRYEDLTPPERAALDAWNRVSADTTGMLYAVRAALVAERKPVERRSARAEAARGILATDVGPDVRAHLAPIAAGYAPDARERLARHLYVTESPGNIMAAEDWDRNDMNRRPYYERADELLAVITGTKEN